MKLTQTATYKLIAFQAISIFAIYFNPMAIAQPSLDSHKICPNNLETEIETIINKPEQKRVFWGIVVKSLNSNQILYQLNGDKYFVPASNVKLLTTAAVLLKFGSDYRINTPVYISGKPPNLKSLRIVGKGDPTLTTDDLKKLAQKLKNMGVIEIEEIILEDDFLPNPQLNPTWEWTDLYYDYAVPVNSLILNENAVNLSLLPQKINEKLDIKWSDYIAAQQWLINNQTSTGDIKTNNNITVNVFFQKPVLEFQGELAIDSKSDDWGLSILNPKEYFLESLKHILTQEGITVINHNNLSSEIDEQNELYFTFQSPSLAELIKNTNQNSNNLFAEVLLKYLVSEENNKDYIAQLESILTELGVEKNSYKLIDGSGLSRHNLATPNTFTDVLILMSKTKYKDIYRQSLAVAGINGTLENRFKNTSIEGNLQGKTGTLSGISALSGYLEIPNYEPLVFSIMVNNSIENPSNIRQIIDEIVIVLSHLNKC